MIILKFPSLSFPLVYVHIPHVLTSILCLFHEWETVFCQVISILSISFWNTYIYEAEQEAFLLPLLGLLWAIFICVGDFHWFLDWFELFSLFFHSASSTLRDFELKPKTHGVAPHPGSLQGLPFVIFWVPSPGRP